jgi:hypothetical protein
LASRWGRYKSDPPRTGRIEARDEAMLLVRMSGKKQADGIFEAVAY